VAAFAQGMGGGGHVRAAGFSSDQGPEATAKNLQPALDRLAVAASG
jgi:nanoRNase/pAp phosphatase (c-di-AMP/oligoRNAs hydrolase)